MFDRSKNIKILGIDIGIKKIGLAQCLYLKSSHNHNPITLKTQMPILILPIEPIIRKNRNQAAHELEYLIESEGYLKVVVGIPECHTTKKRILHFISLLCVKTPIIYINEDLTSKESEQDLLHMKKNNRKNAKKNGRMDSIAACKILQRYVEGENLNSSI